jgi:hypothetical protein
MLKYKCHESIFYIVALNIDRLQYIILYFFKLIILQIQQILLYSL